MLLAKLAFLAVSFQSCCHCVIYSCGPGGPHTPPGDPPKISFNLHKTDMVERPTYKYVYEKHQIVLEN